MEVQSLSIVVPAKCMNRCPFCVSHMNQENKYFRKHQESDLNLYLDNVKKRMEFARDNGTNTLMITSTGEALENMKMIAEIIYINDDLTNPFKWIEFQTSGVGLINAVKQNPYVFSKMSTISISVIDVFDSKNNKEAMRMPQEVFKKGNKLYTSIKDIVWWLKEKDFNVRLSINLTDIYDEYGIGVGEKIYNRLLDLDVDQVTFRKLYKSGRNTKQDKWIDEFSAKKALDYILMYVRDNGKPLERLPFGAMKYSLNGISTVIDEDCMSKETKNVLKYLIIRENGKLYSRWDDKGSLIF